MTITPDTNDPTAVDVDAEPTLRQMVHAATGDREAEARALKDRIDETRPDDAPQPDDETLHAVRRAHGDLGDEDPPGTSELATTEDVPTRPS